MGWTLREIADRSGVSSRFLSDLEAGKGNISVARLADVARALDVPMVSLMPSEEDQKSVVALVGLRGAGKSTIGKAVAKHLGVPFFELDALIEKEANLSLGELFSLHGESYYKRLAYDILLKVLARNEPRVIATGGSVVTDPESAAAAEWPQRCQSPLSQRRTAPRCCLACRTHTARPRADSSRHGLEQPDRREDER